MRLLIWDLCFRILGKPDRKDQAHSSHCIMIVSLVNDSNMIIHVSTSGARLTHIYTSIGHRIFSLTTPSPLGIWALFAYLKSSGVTHYKINFSYFSNICVCATKQRCARVDTVSLLLSVTFWFRIYNELNFQFYTSSVSGVVLRIKHTEWLLL